MTLTFTERILTSGWGWMGSPVSGSCYKRSPGVSLFSAGGSQEPDAWHHCCRDLHWPGIRQQRGLMHYHTSWGGISARLRPAHSPRKEVSFCSFKCQLREMKVSTLWATHLPRWFLFEEHFIICVLSDLLQSGSIQVQAWHHVCPHQNCNPPVCGHSQPVCPSHGHRIKHTVFLMSKKLEHKSTCVKMSFHCWRIIFIKVPETTVLLCLPACLPLCSTGPGPVNGSTLTGQQVDTFSVWLYYLPHLAALWIQRSVCELSSTCNYVLTLKGQHHVLPVFPHVCQCLCILQCLASPNKWKWSYLATLN